VCAYVATGVWWHYRLTRDAGCSKSCGRVDRAIGFVLGLQRPGGEFTWSVDPDGVPGRFALLTSTASIYHSLRCALAIGGGPRYRTPQWSGPPAWPATLWRTPRPFRGQVGLAMDWYYRCCQVRWRAKRAPSPDRRWDDFVMEDLGVRCIVDNPWVTAAETSEFVIALDAVGMLDEAEQLAGWTRHLREENGAYWTGCVHPSASATRAETLHLHRSGRPAGRHVLYGGTPASGLFRDDTYAAEGWDLGRPRPT